MEMKIKLQPFTVPNYVIGQSDPKPRQDGFAESLKWSLSEVDEDALSALCDRFRHDVFTKAGKKDPKQLR